MSERQSDEMLDDVERRIRANVCYRCDGAKQLSPGYDCFACEGTGMFALSSSFALDLIAELRERRAQDLTAEEREALDMVKREQDEELAWTVDVETKALRKRAIAVLDKLLAGGAK